MLRQHAKVASRGAQAAPDDVDVTSQVVELVREGLGEADAANGILNAFDFQLSCDQVLVARIGVDRGFQNLEPIVPTEQSPTHDPFVEQRQIVEHRIVSRPLTHRSGPLRFAVPRTGTGNAMNDTTGDLDQAEEDILTYAVSDEALEAAAGTERGSLSFCFPASCF
jgi:hypothetical protein